MSLQVCLHLQWLQNKTPTTLHHTESLLGTANILSLQISPSSLYLTAGWNPIRYTAVRTNWQQTGLERFIFFSLSASCSYSYLHKKEQSQIIHLLVLSAKLSIFWAEKFLPYLKIHLLFTFIISTSRDTKIVKPRLILPIIFDTMLNINMRQRCKLSPPLLSTVLEAYNSATVQENNNHI